MKSAWFMVASYMSFCTILATRPCKYFQLNASYFNPQLGIFSKHDLNARIPHRWRLRQWRLNELFALANPAHELSFPAFVKPEWGQNAYAVSRVDNMQQLESWQALSAEQDWLVQACAHGAREYEIFTLRQHKDHSACRAMSITEVCNDEHAYPINSIYNANTSYIDISERFDKQDRDRLWQYVREIGDFAIARVSVRAHSREKMLEGDFQVIEINLFAPMPIHMMDRKYGVVQLAIFIIRYMWMLALLTKYRDRNQPEYPVFLKSWWYKRHHPLIRYLRARL